MVTKEVVGFGPHGNCASCGSVPGLLHSHSLQYGLDKHVSKSLKCKHNINSPLCALPVKDHLTCSCPVSVSDTLRSLLEKIKGRYKTGPLRTQTFISHRSTDDSVYANNSLFLAIWEILPGLRMDWVWIMLEITLVSCSFLAYFSQWKIWRVVFLLLKGRSIKHSNSFTNS